MFRKRSYPLKKVTAERVLRKGKVLMLLIIAVFFVSGSDLAGAAAGNSILSPILSVSQAGTAGDELQYHFLLHNYGQQDHQYQLSILSLPEGFQGSIATGNTESDKTGDKPGNVKIKANGDQPLTVKVKVPETAKAGNVFFKIRLKRDDGQSENLPLTINVNRNYQLAIIDHPRDLNVPSGQSQLFGVTLANNGSKELTGIKLKFDLPGKWLIEGVTPSTMDLKPGNQGSFQVKLFVPPTQTAGTKKLTITAYNQNAESTALLGPVNVQKSPSYLIWIIVLVIIMAMGTIYYFRKFGRR